MDMEGTGVSGRSASTRSRVGRGAEWFVSGCGVLVVMGSAILYITGLSRTVGLLALPFAIVLFASAGYVHRRRWPHPVWVVAFALIAVVTVGCGIWLLVYSALHPPVAV